MKHLVIMILAAVISAAGIAEGAEVDPALKVDLRVVVSSGEVQAVDGITSAGQPDEAALKVFAASGYTTVIDLRTAAEDHGIDEPTVIEELGMEYVRLPIAELSAINFNNARILDTLIDAAAGPVLIHCASGNRVGALLALRESLNGADDEAALEVGREGGMTRLEGRVRDVLNED